MAYIGRDIEYGSFTKQTLTANGSTTVFALDQSVLDAKSLLVSVGGVIQEPDVAYTASGTTLTFTGTPVTGDPIWIVYLGKMLGTSSTREAITYQTATGDGSATTVAMTSTGTTGTIIVTLNGVMQTPSTDFSVSGSTLTFTSAPFTGAAIGIYYIGKKAKLAVPAADSIQVADLAAGGTLPAWDGSALTGIVSITKADIFEMQNNIALLNFLRANDITAKRTSMLNGFQDQFRTEDGIVAYNGTTVDHTVTSLLQFNFEDNITPVSNPSSYTITSNGSYPYDADGKFNKGIQFGAGGLGRNQQGFTITGFPAGAKTISMWIKVIDNNNNPYIFDGRNAGGDTSPPSYRNVNNTKPNDYINGSIISSETALSIGSWTHVVFCINEANLTGVTIGSRYAQSASQWDSANIIMDKLEIFNGILTASQVSTVYNAQTPAGAAETPGTGSSELTYSNNTYTNKSPTHNLSIMTKGTDDLSEVDSPSSAPTKGHLEVLLNDSVGLIDSSSSSYTLTAFGGVSNSTAVKKIGASSIYFDGNGDYLSVGTQGDNNWKFAGTNFTVEFWMYLPINLGTATGVISTSTSPATYASLGWHVGIYGTGPDNGVLYWEGSNGSSSEGHIVDSNNAPSATNTWHHVAVVRNGSTITLYKNGTSVGTSSSSGTMHTPQVLRIGRRDADASPADFNGYLDEIRISHTARYTSNFTPSTTAFTADADTKLLIHGDIPQPTLNTDLIGEMSRNGGTTWSPATLRRVDKVIAGSDYDVLMGDVDFTGDPSGTNIKGRIRTVNAENVTVKGMAVNWL